MATTDPSRHADNSGCPSAIPFDEKSHSVVDYWRVAEYPGILETTIGGFGVGIGHLRTTSLPCSTVDIDACELGTYKHAMWVEQIYEPRYLSYRSQNSKGDDT